MKGRGGWPSSASRRFAASGGPWRTAKTPALGRGCAVTLAQSLNQALADLLAQYPNALVFGEDVARKGGVYRVTAGLQERFGATRVFDTASTRIRIDRACGALLLLLALFSFHQGDPSWNTATARAVTGPDDDAVRRLFACSPQRRKLPIVVS